LAFAGLLFSCSGLKGYDPEGFSYRGYREKGGSFTLNLSRDYASILGTWSQGPLYGLVEGESKADGYVRLKLFAPGTTETALGTFEGAYAGGEGTLKGRLIVPGGKEAREARLDADPSLTAGLSASRLRDSTRKGLAADAVEPTRFYYLGFEPSGEKTFLKWYRDSFQGGLDMDSAMKKERDGFFADFAASVAANGQSAKAWYYEGRQFIGWRSARLLTMGLRLATSTGNPGGEASALRYAVIDQKAAAVLGPDAFLAAGWPEALRPLIEAEARRTLGLPPGASLAAAGMFADKLPPSSNFYVYGEGLGFHYNSYELGPAVAGGLWVNLPFTTLAGLLKPGALADYGLSPAR
jgi:hypothetical protein